MPLIYDANSKIFLKQDYKKHSGRLACSKESPVEMFCTNHFINSEQFDSNFFEFDTPLYYTLGGTLNYYAQDYWSIFTNVYQPFIKFIFTANTNHFGTGTTIIHKIYKVQYKDYIEYSNEIAKKNVNEDKNYLEETIDALGAEKITKTVKTVLSTNTSGKSNQKPYPQNVPGFDMFGSKGYSKITNSMSNPILTITAATSGFSTNIYNLFLGQYQKNFGDFQYQLFQDYGQYFITTQFQFIREQAADLSDFYKLGNNNALVPIEYQKYYEEITPVPHHTITGGTYSGITVYGNFFTYFLMPNKPKWESPIVEGQLDTFSPTFYWSQTDDGDNYLLQIVYNSGDSATFSGTVYSYPINKEESMLSTEEVLGLPAGDWSITQKTTDVVRKYTIPLLRAKNFWYRIGNIKEMVDIFGVKQKVVTFSDIGSGITTSDSYNSYVYVQSDSPHMTEMSTFVYPEYLTDSLGQYTLSGTVSGSIVTGATMQLTYPDGTYTTQTTDLFGNFVFTNLEPAMHILSTRYRGYQSDSRAINITGNTYLAPFKINLVWGNDYDTWGKMANENFFL